MKSKKQQSNVIYILETIEVLKNKKDQTIEDLETIAMLKNSLITEVISLEKYLEEKLAA